MTRLLLIVMIVVMIAGNLANGIDKLPVIGFTGGGYSLLPAQDYMIGYMEFSGVVNWNKLNQLLQRISNEGACAWREFPPWPTPEPEFKNLAPFEMINGQIKWNDLYFENLQKIFQFAYHQYNLLPVFDLFNASETRVKPAKEHSPWKNYNDYFYNPDSTQTRHTWMLRVLNAAEKIPVFYQLCNEPPAKAAEMMIDTYLFLIDNNIPPARIIIGWDIHKKKTDKAYGTAYNKWRDGLIKELPKKPAFTKSQIGQIIKGESWTPIHGMTAETVQEYFRDGLEPGEGVPSASSRNTIYSTDAVNPRLNFAGGLKLASAIIKTKPAAINAGKIWIEITIGKESGLLDPLGQLKGCISKITEKYGPPLNKGRYPAPLPLPTWIGETVTPAPRQYSVEPAVFSAPPLTTPPPASADKIKSDSKTIFLIIGAVVVGALVFLFIKYPLITALAFSMALMLSSLIAHKKKWKYYYVLPIAGYILYIVAGTLSIKSTIGVTMFAIVGVLNGFVSVKLIKKN